MDQYPLPKQKDLFVKLLGGKKFTKLDFSYACNQVELEPTSKNIVTINTHKGLFRPTRLVYGVSQASAMFQNTDTGDLDLQWDDRWKQVSKHSTACKLNHLKITARCWTAKKEKNTIQRCNCANKTTENKLNKTSRNIAKMRRTLNTIILRVKKDLKNRGDKFTFQTHKKWRHTKGQQKSSTTDMVMRIFCKMMTIEGHKTHWKWRQIQGL